MKLLDKDLYRVATSSDFAFATTAEVTPSDEPIDQARAKDAIDFATGMEFFGYNLYALGSPRTDKQAIVTTRLKSLAASRPTPEDLCYLRNFEDPDRPTYLTLPAGEGRRFRSRMQEAVSRIRDTLPAAFTTEEYRNEVQGLTSSYREMQSQDAADLNEQAQARGLTMLPTPNGFVFAPTRDGKVMEQEEFLALNEEERQAVQKSISEMSQQLVERLQDYPQHEQELLEQQRELQRRTAEAVIRRCLVRLRSRYQDQNRIMTYLLGVENELLANLDKLLAPSKEGLPPWAIQGGDPELLFDHFKVNLLVDRSDGGGAPVLYESNPSLENLVGKVAHRMELGVPVTDFSMASAGALHRANGGFLILDAERLLQKPFAWEALKRALDDRCVRIESVNQLLNLTYSVSLEPEAVPLEVKVVLLGNRRLYHLLKEYDSDFDKLFKVVADFDDYVDWNQENLNSYAQAMARLIAQAKTRHLTADAVGRVIEHSSRMVEDQEQMSTHIADLRDLLQEADYVANQAGAELIDRVHVSQAIDRRIYQLDRFRELVRENIAKGMILVQTSGEKVGQVNGLSVVSLGQIQFGQPSRITATARLGRGELIDIERESQLAGKIHSKAVMIVSSFIGARYAKEKPLSLHASLVFEQTYGGIEGDSASVAEVCALLSAIIDRPIQQCWALTGSMDQHGVVQAIGGVNEKVEGFFDVCCVQGLTGKQGVIIPEANRHQLMLREDVVRAVAEGKFHVHTMSTVDDAMALLFAPTPGELAVPSEIDAAIHDRVDHLHELSKKHSKPEEAKS